MMPRQPEMVIMGNCICSRCYEVGWDVRNAVAGENAEKHPQGRLDLKLAALELLHRAGLPMEVPVVSVQGCTKCSNELFHSHRRDGTDERNLQWFSPS